MGVLIQENFNLNKNEKSDQSFFEWFVDYTSKTSGTRRILSLVRQCAKLTNEIGSKQSILATRMEKAAATSMSALGVVRLPSTTKDAIDSICHIGQDDGISFTKKSAVAFRDAMEAIGSWCSMTALLVANPILKSISQISDLGSDTADFGLSLNDYGVVAKHEEAATGEVKEALIHTRRYHMFCVAKAVLSLAAAIFAVIAMITGFNILPIVVSIFLSLATTCLSIQRDLFKDGGKYHLIDLH